MATRPSQTPLSNRLRRYHSWGLFAMDCRSDAAEAIVKATGFADGAKVFFTNAGAESNENAIKIARQYTGKQKIFSQYRCYHGSSAGAGMLTGEPRHFFNEPGGPGFVKYDGALCIQSS